MKDTNSVNRSFKDNYDMFSKGWVAGRKDLLKWLETWIKSDLHRSIDAFVFTEMEKIKKELKQDELIK